MSGISAVNQFGELYVTTWTIPNPKQGRYLEGMMTRELESDLIHLTANLGYFSDIEIGRFMRKVLQREVEKAKAKEARKYSYKFIKK